jgi:hypothetical protein
MKRLSMKINKYVYTWDGFCKEFFAAAIVGGWLAGNNGGPWYIWVLFIIDLVLGTAKYFVRR